MSPQVVDVGVLTGQLFAGSAQFGLKRGHPLSNPKQEVVRVLWAWGMSFGVKGTDGAR